MIESKFNIPIKIQHLGAVDDASIELKPLTVFVGENSTGKTYTAYLISYIFSKYAYSKYQSLLNDDEDYIKYEEIELLLDDLYKKGIASFDLKKFIEKNSNKYFNFICEDIVQNNFKDFLASDTLLFDDLKVNLNLEEVKKIQYSRLSPKFLQYMSENENNFENEKKCESYKFMEIDNEKLIIKFEINQKLIKTEEIRPKTYEVILQLLHRSIFNEVYFLGAERTGMALFYHTVTKRKLRGRNIRNSIFRKPKDKVNKEDIRFQFSQPVQELFDNVKTIFNPYSENIKDKRIIDKTEINQYLKFADILENQILGGNISIKKDDEDIVRKLIFNYQTDCEIPLDMTITSSSVKGLSPLILYLKYFIEPNELIIIDEPEINLHPKAQVQLIELLAMLANSKVNIIITTHSPYIIDHLINLMKASNCTNKSEIAQKFYLGKEEAFIDKENVSAYLFERNSAIDILSKEGEINWKTFSRISEEITDLYFELDDYYAL